jgi:hypothetical protein
VSPQILSPSRPDGRGIPKLPIWAKLVFGWKLCYLTKLPQKTNLNQISHFSTDVRVPSNFEPFKARWSGNSKITNLGQIGFGWKLCYLVNEETNQKDNERSKISDIQKVLM